MEPYDTGVAALVNLQGIVENIITINNSTDGGTWAGLNTYWTHERGEFRKNYATIGGTYDTVRDAFIGIKPGPEYVLNEETCQWELPG